MERVLHNRNVSGSQHITEQHSFGQHDAIAESGHQVAFILMIRTGQIPVQNRTSQVYSKTVARCRGLLCRASIPVFTCILSMVFERKIPTKAEAASLLVLTMGVMLAMWRNNAAGSPWAICLCLAGTICNAGMMSLSGKVLSEKVDVLQLTFYTSPISFLAILPAFLYREVGPQLACPCS